MQIHVRGVASHAGVVPEKGVSAIAIASLAIAELQREGWHGRIEKDGREGTSNVGVIHGGKATNIVAAEVDVAGRGPESRSRLPPQDCPHHSAGVPKGRPERPQRRRALRPCAGRGCLDYESFRLGLDEPCILAAEAAVRRCGGEPVRALSNGGLDANWMTARGIPTVTLGCGQENGHTVRSGSI